MKVIQVVKTSTGNRRSQRLSHKLTCKNLAQNNNLPPINLLPLNSIFSQQGKSSSKNSQKGNNSSKKEKKTCSYCKRNGHDEHECKDKQIDELINLMRKHKIDVPNAYKDKGSSTTSKGKGQALVATTNNVEEWVLDLGATHYMGASKEHFSSLKPSKVPYIYVANDTQVEL